MEEGEVAVSHARTIAQMDLEDRPREKLEAIGAEHLKASELLAILIGNGTVGESAVDLMHRVMKDNDGKLRRVGNLTIKDLIRYKGIGKAKAITIIAACEIGRRRAIEEAFDEIQYDNPQTIYNYLKHDMQNLDHEEFHVLYLNNSLKMVARQKLASGGMTATTVDIRLLAKNALHYGATNIVVAHNHPSGSPNPSRHDDHLTERIKAAMNLLDIHLIDHIVVGDQKYYSYAENAQL